MKQQFPTPFFPSSILCPLSLARSLSLLPWSLAETGQDCMEEKKGGRKRKGTEEEEEEERERREDALARKNRKGEQAGQMKCP